MVDVDYFGFETVETNPYVLTPNEGDVFMLGQSLVLFHNDSILLIEEVLNWLTSKDEVINTLRDYVRGGGQYAKEVFQLLKPYLPNSQEV